MIINKKNLSHTFCILLLMLNFKIHGMIDITMISLNAISTGRLAGRFVAKTYNNNYNQSDFDYLSNLDEEYPGYDTIRAIKEAKKRENLIRAQRSKDLIEEIEGKNHAKESLVNKYIKLKKPDEKRTPGLLSQFVATNPYLIASLIFGATIGLMYLTYAKMSKKIKANQK